MGGSATMRDDTKYDMLFLSQIKTHKIQSRVADKTREIPVVPVTRAIPVIRANLLLLTFQNVDNWRLDFSTAAHTRITQMIEITRITRVTVLLFSKPSGQIGVALEMPPESL